MLVKKLNYFEFKSPLGTICLVSDNKSLYSLDYGEYKSRLHKLLKRRFANYEINESQDNIGITEKLERYFAKELTTFNDIRVSLLGTKFQTKVWDELIKVPFGKIMSYSDLANKVDNPKAVRAVANSNANNPIAIIVPCHRIIGKNGTLTGYAGGLNRKEWLLKHEGIDI